MAKAKYRVTNWHDYNDVLKKCGSLTVWLEEGFEFELIDQVTVSSKIWSGAINEISTHFLKL